MNRLPNRDYTNQLPNKPAEDDGVFRCPGCSCTWFEHVVVKQFNKNTTTILGQDIPTANFSRICLLRCVKCNELLEPNLLYTGTDALRQKYHKLLELLEGK